MNALMEAVNAYQDLVSNQEKVALLMLASKTHEQQKEMEDHIAYDMVNELKRDGWIKKKVIEKGKGRSKDRKKVPSPPKKDNHAKDVECCHCGKIGH
ncbi:hypothetical protein Tco_0162109 [Tanacetum coccineum]